MNDSYTCKLDDQLGAISHFSRYPEMFPWVGDSYLDSVPKLMLIGESHYLNQESKYHRDPQVWYQGLTVDERDKSYIDVRKIVGYGLKDNWQGKEKSIFRNLEEGVASSGIFPEDGIPPFRRCAYMNFFQRPAEKTGKSIKVHNIDIEVSSEVFGSVVNIVRPDAVVFASSLAFSKAKKGEALNQLKYLGIDYKRVPHPGCAWWNRRAKKYKNRNGKEIFIDFLQS